MQKYDKKPMIAKYMAKLQQKNKLLKTRDCLLLQEKDKKGATRKGCTSIYHMGISLFYKYLLDRQISAGRLHNDNINATFYSH